MARLYVQMFGKLCIHWDQEVCVSFDSRKALELFCYLLLYPNRPHARETLAETIWGETSPGKSKKYLRQALWHLQSGLTSPSNDEEIPMLLADSVWIQINPQTDLWVDVVEFERAFLLTKGIPGLELNTEQLSQLKRAVELYQGDLLEGCYEDWCLYERERLQNMYLTILDKLMECCENLHQYEDALAFGERILRFEMASERTHRRMARIYYKAGKRTNALRQYERCVTALNEELGIKPSKQTVELYEQICQDKVTEANKMTPAEYVSASSSELITHLERLQQSLDSFYEQAHAEIHTLEMTLRNNQALTD